MGPRSWRQASRLRRCSFLLCHRQRPAWATQPGPQHPHRPSLIPGERGQEGPFCPVPWLQRWHCPCPACLPLALPGRAAPMVQGWRQVAPARCVSCSRLKDLLPRKAGGATRRKPQQAAQREGGRGRAPAPLAWAWATGCGWELCCQASHTVRPLPVAVGEPPRVVRGAAGPVAGGDPAPGRPAGVGQVQQTGAER